jgi:hypothetical protein
MAATGVTKFDSARVQKRGALALLASALSMSPAAQAQTDAPPAPAATEPTTLPAPPPSAPEATPNDNSALQPAVEPPAQAAPTVTPSAAPAAAPPPPAATVNPQPAAAEPPKSAFRPAARGFQAAFRTGLLFPVGDATSQPNDTLASRYAWQVPIAVDLGMRFAQNYFVGGYLGIGFGSTGSDARLERACSDDDDDLENDIVCSAVTLRAGVEVHYNFRPDQRLNPWVGYGFGFEAASAKLSDHAQGYEETVTSSGLTYAQLSAGFDMRHAVGFGPFVEAAVGSFRRVTTDSGAALTTSRPIDDQALHAWLMLGLRLVVNP